MRTTINEIKYYNCGYCTNNMGLVFKKHPKEIRKFPAGVFLMKHPEKGYILFDTGYSTALFHVGWKGKLYNLLNPTCVREEEQIHIQLDRDGIKCSEIRYLILSHLHPDHIGCVKHFQNAEILLSEDAYDTYRHNKTRYLIFKKLLPEWFEGRVKVISDVELSENSNPYFSYYDLFDDHSLLLTKVNGHAKGQLCCLIENKVFLGADASWGNDFVGKAADFRVFPRLIQSDMQAYIDGDQMLLRLRQDGVRLCFSHDTYSEEVIPL